MPDQSNLFLISIERALITKSKFKWFIIVPMNLKKTITSYGHALLQIRKQNII